MEKMKAERLKPGGKERNERILILLKVSDKDSLDEKRILGHVINPARTSGSWVDPRQIRGNEGFHQGGQQNEWYQTPNEPMQRRGKKGPEGCPPADFP